MSDWANVRQWPSLHLIPVRHNRPLPAPPGPHAGTVREGPIHLSQPFVSLRGSRPRGWRLPGPSKPACQIVRSEYTARSCPTGPLGTGAVGFGVSKRWRMSRVCHFTGKKTRAGRSIARRGKAKYLGGVGRKTTGTTSASSSPTSSACAPWWTAGYAESGCRPRPSAWASSSNRRDAIGSGTRPLRQPVPPPPKGRRGQSPRTPQPSSEATSGDPVPESG